MGNTPGFTRLCVIFLSTAFGVFSYRVPNITMEAKYPFGFRVFIPDQRGVEEFGFNANINEPLESYEPGEISAEVKEKTGQFWLYHDDEISLEPGDALYYWAYVVFRGVVYKRTRQKWVCINFVREFSNITLPRRPSFYPKMPSFHHPFRPFTPQFPWSNFTTEPPSPTLPSLGSATTKRSIEITTASPSPSPPPPTTAAAETANPTTTTANPTTTTAPEIMPELMTTTRIPEPETTTSQMTTILDIFPQVMTTTRIPEPETTTVQATTVPETTTLEVTTTEVTTTAVTTTETEMVDVTTSPPTTVVPEVPVISGLPPRAPEFCNESISTATEENISTTMPDVTPARPYAPPVYWPSNREDCLNVWSSSYQPSMTTLKMTKSVILLECQVMSQKRKMTRVRSELFSLSKSNYEVEARLEALEKKVFGHPQVMALHAEESK